MQFLILSLLSSVMAKRVRTFDRLHRRLHRRTPKMIRPIIVRMNPKIVVRPVPPAIAKSPIIVKVDKQNSLKICDNISLIKEAGFFKEFSMAEIEMQKMKLQNLAALTPREKSDRRLILSLLNYAIKNKSYDLQKLISEKCLTKSY